MWACVFTIYFITTGRSKFTVTQSKWVEQVKGEHIPYCMVHFKKCSALTQLITSPKIYFNFNLIFKLVKPNFTAVLFLKTLGFREGWWDNLPSSLQRGHNSFLTFSTSRHVQYSEGYFSAWFHNPIVFIFICLIQINAAEALLQLLYVHLHWIYACVYKIDSCIH